MDAFETSHFRSPAQALPAAVPAVRTDFTADTAEAAFVGSTILGTLGGAVAAVMWVAPLVGDDFSAAVGITGAAVGAAVSSLLAAWFAGRRGSASEGGV